MSNPDKLPRGHAYIHMRNRGGKIDLDYPEMDSPEVARMMKAVMAILGEEIEKAKEVPSD